MQDAPNIAVLSAARKSRATTTISTVVAAVTNRPSRSCCLSERVGHSGRAKSTTTTLLIAFRLESRDDIAAARAPEITMPAMPVGSSCVMKCGKTSSAESELIAASCEARCQHYRIATPNETHHVSSKVLCYPVAKTDRVGRSVLVQGGARAVQPTRLPDCGGRKRIAQPQQG
jgi:hypothetical protein